MSGIDGWNSNNSLMTVNDPIHNLSPNSNENKGYSEEDIKLLVSLLKDISRWLDKKVPESEESENPDGVPFPDQIWKANLTPRNFGDPMGDFIAGIGRA